MIETEQTVIINTAIEKVWDYAQDIRRWANIFPGCRECAIIDDNNSHWTIKVGVGGLVRTVNVLVHVDQWAGPERVNFSYQLKAEPVVGSGTYIARRKGAHETEVTLQVCVKGSGSMAPMWEAMCKPLIPTLARSFANELKAEIEKSAGIPEAAKAPSIFVRIWQWLRNLWLSIFSS